MTNNPISSILDRYPALIIDGALATELERRGYGTFAEHIDGDGPDAERSPAHAPGAA